MKVVRYYSHLNGYEHIRIHKPHLWSELLDVINIIDSELCKTKVCNEVGPKKGQMLYNPIELNALFKKELEHRDWKESRTSYYVTADERLIRRTMTLSAEEQRTEIETAGQTPIYSYNQTDFVKDRVEIEVQFGKYFSVAYDLFVKHMAFFIRDVIDVGIEVLPMKSMQTEMSSGPPYYEAELYNLIRQGRSTPAVPLIIVGIAP
jgi:hypothetical protein